MPRILRSTFVFLVLVCCARVGWAQQQLTGLADPISVTVQQSTGETFIYEQAGNRLLRWNGEEPKPVTGLLSEAPARMSVVVASQMRDTNSIVLLGYAEQEATTLRIAAFKIQPSGAASFEPGLSADLLLGPKPGKITAVTSTPLAVYVATQADSRNQLWKIPTFKATLAKARTLRKLPAPVTAMTVNPQGHVVLATQAETGSRLEFIQSESGQRLMSLPTNLKTVSSLSYHAKTGLLYATGETDGPGVFRLDATFAGNQQHVRGVEVLAMKGARQIVCAPQRDLVLVGGDSGRLITVDLSAE